MATGKFLQWKWRMVALLSAFIVVASATFIFLFTRRSSSSSVEHFNPDPYAPQVTLKDDAETVQRNAFAVEACGILESHSDGIGDNEYNVMNSVLKGYRFNKWKPSENDPAKAQMKDDKMYCYMYNDRDNNIADYMVSGESACDKQNPLFADNPMITNVFANSYTDRTHVLPIKKCVVEIDPNAATVSNVEHMWKKWGQSHCDVLSSSLRDELATSKTIFSKAEQRYNTLVGAEEYINGYRTQLTGDLASCGRCNQEWTDAYAVKWNDYIAQEEAMATETEKLSRLLTSNETLRTSNDVFKSDYDRWKEMWSSQSNAYWKCKPQLDTCKVMEAHALSNFQSASHQNRGLTNSNNALQTEKTNYTNLYNDQANHHARCDATLRSETDKKRAKYDQLIQVTGWYNTCNTERTHFSNMYATYSNMYTTVFKDYTSCDGRRNMTNNNLRNTQKGNVDCSHKRGTLEQSYIQTQRALSTEETNLKEAKETLRKNKESLFDCQKRKSNLESVKKNLLQNNVDLYNQLEIAYQKLRKERVVAFDNQKNAVSGSYASLLNIGKGCQANLDEIRVLEEQVQSIMDDKVDKGSMCLNCNPTEEQCAIYKEDSTICPDPQDVARIEKSDAEQGLPK
jgi:hypothetical protein